MAASRKFGPFVGAGLIWGTCKRCAVENYVRAVSGRDEHVCDPCASVVLTMTVRAFVDDLPTWKGTIVSPFEVRSVIEHRRRLLLGQTPAEREKECS